VQSVASPYPTRNGKQDDSSQLDALALGQFGSGDGIFLLLREKPTMVPLNQWPGEIHGTVAEADFYFNQLRARARV